MEDKSVLVIKSLVMLRVKRITALCLTKTQESEIQQIIDSLGGKSTKVVSKVVDPSNPLL